MEAGDISALHASSFDPKTAVMHTINAVRDEIDARSAAMFIANLIDMEEIHVKEARILSAAVSDRALSQAPPRNKKPLACIHSENSASRSYQLRGYLTMLCENCKKNQATTYFKTVINGEAREMHFCNECAKKFGGLNFFPNGFGLDGILSGLLGQYIPAQKPQTERLSCPVCGSTLDDFSESGRVGCANCYDAFYQSLMPYIRKIHGRCHARGPYSSTDYDITQAAHSGA